MIRLKDQHEQLVKAVEEYAADPRSIVKQRIRNLIPHGVPFWVAEPRRQQLLDWGLHPQLWLPGRAWGVVAYGDRAFLACLVVSLERSEFGQELPLPVCLSPETADSLQDAAHVAKLIYPHFWPIEPRSQLRFRVLDLAGNELEVNPPVKGRSLGLAALVATFSLMAHRPVAPGLVFTGSLGIRQPDGEVPVERVECITIKQRESRAAGARLVLPAASSVGLTREETGMAVGTASQALAHALGSDWRSQERCRPPLVQDVTADLEWWDMQYRRNTSDSRWPRLAECFEAFTLLPVLPAAERIRAVCRAVACLTHCDSLREADLTRLRQVMDGLDPELVEGLDEVTARTHLSIAYRHVYDFEEALHQVRQSCELAGRLRLHREKAKARSTLGQLLAAMGRAEEGLEHLRAGLEYYETRGSPECSRNHCYLMDGLFRAGRVDEAEQEYTLGLQHTEARLEPQNWARQKAFLNYARLNGRLRQLRRAPGDRAGWKWLQEEAGKALRAECAPLPLVGLERIRDAAALRCATGPGEREAVLTVAAERLCSRPGKRLRWQGGMVFLEVALEELEWGEGVENARRWLRCGLRVIPNREAWRFLSVGRALRARTPPALREAILSILEREQY